MDLVTLNLRLRRLESYRIRVGDDWPTDEYSQEEVEKQLDAIKDKLIFPGQLICAAKGDILDSRGTRLKGGWLVSKLMGRVAYYRDTRVMKSRFPPYDEYKANFTVVEVFPLQQPKSLMPQDGERIAGIVYYVCDRMVKVHMTHNQNGLPFQKPFFRGIIKPIEAGGNDNSTLLDKFRIGDSIFAIYTGSRMKGGFLLRTDEPDLGVICAKGPNSNNLLPISDCRMIDPVEKKEYSRKVAHPQKRDSTKIDDITQQLKKTKVSKS